MSTFTETHILKGSDFSVEDVSIGKPKVNSSGGKSIPIFNTKAKKLFTLSTPLMLTWGVNENDYEGNGNKKYDLALQFPSDDYATEATTKFLDNMKQFEEHIRSQAITNSKEWFNKSKMTEEVIDALWTPILKYPKIKEADGSYGEPDTTRSPTLKVKLPFWDNTFTSEIYDLNGTCLFPCDDPSITPMSLVPKKSQIAAVVQCGGIWFAGGKFGVTWKLVQTMVKPNITSLKGKCHIQLDDTEMNKMKNQEVNDVQQDEAAQSTEVMDSDDDDEPAPEPEAAPPPAKKKKIVKKVKA